MPIKDQQKLREARRRADAKRAAKRAGTRTRSWACIAWLDSAPDGWIERLKERHVPTLISPLHDKDIAYDEATDAQKIKKPHWHVLAMFENPVTEQQAQEYFCSAGICYTLDGTPAPPEMVRGAKGYARYLVHMDDHDKYRYDDGGVMELGSVTWRSVALDPAEEVDMIQAEIERFVRQAGYDSYSLLLAYAADNRPDWAPVLRKRTMWARGMVQSYAYDVTSGVEVPPVDSPAWQRQQLAREREAAKR